MRDVGHSCVGIRAASASVLRSETSRPLQLLRSGRGSPRPVRLRAHARRCVVKRSRSPAVTGVRRGRARGRRAPAASATPPRPPPQAHAEAGAPTGRDRGRAGGTRWRRERRRARGAGSRAAAPRPLGPRPAALSARVGARRGGEGRRGGVLGRAPAGRGRPTLRVPLSATHPRPHTSAWPDRVPPRPSPPAPALTCC